MRRAMTRVGLALCVAALLPAGAPAEGVKLVNGIGLVDYTRPPDFKVGDWASYRITASSLAGARDDYKVTVLIAGEENFWGEDGFWVETWSEEPGGASLATATLMSYAIFDDSLPIAHMQLFQRKGINELGMDGMPSQMVLRRTAGGLKLRTPFDDRIAWDVDTLGQDTVSTPQGTFQCLKVSTRQGKSTTRDVGDSTEYTEVRDNRVSYLSRRIPITSLAREEIEYSIRERKWQIGRSEDAPPLHYLDRSLGEARLIGFGENKKSQILPESMQKSLAGRRASRAPGAQPERKPKPGGARKSG
jgi:hypothetical protein